MKYVRILGKVKTLPGYCSERRDKIRIEEGSLQGIVLEGGVSVLKSKTLGTLEFTGIGKRRREGVDIDFLVSIQPEYVGK